jgi:hypothetical protein
MPPTSLHRFLCRRQSRVKSFAHLRGCWRHPGWKMWLMIWMTRPDSLANLFFQCFFSSRAHSSAHFCPSLLYLRPLDDFSKKSWFMVQRTLGSGHHILKGRDRRGRLYFSWSINSLCIKKWREKVYICTYWWHLYHIFVKANFKNLY